LRGKDDRLPRSRAAVVIGFARWIAWGVQRLFDRGPNQMPKREQEPYNPFIVFLIGVIHGLGAETPSQLLIFLLAANLGGASLGLLGLGVFLAGLITMNLIMTASIVGILGISANKPRVLQWVVGATATYSVVVGVIFFVGGASLLPALGG
jgi:hypothetical protein